MRQLLISLDVWPTYISSSCECNKVVSAIAAICHKFTIYAQHTVSSFGSVALEMVLQVTPSPEEPFQEPLTQGLTLHVARILRIYDKWQLLQIRLSCIHMTKWDKMGAVRLQHSALMSLRADFICSWKHIHAKSRRAVDIKIMRDFHFFFWSDIL